MRIVRCGVVALLVSAIGIVPNPAHAEVTEGECSGSASFVNGTEADGPFSVESSHPQDDVIVIPRADDVEWEVSNPTAEGTLTGYVRANLPFPFGSIQLRSWGGEVVDKSSSGTSDYDLPSIIPGGVTIKLTVNQTDQGGACTAVFTLKLEGGPWGSVLSLASLGLTLLALLAFLAIAGLFRKKSDDRTAGSKVGRGITGAVIGLLLGLFVGADLVLLGIVPIDTVVVFIVILLGLIGGGLLGTRAAAASKASA